MIFKLFSTFCCIVATSYASRSPAEIKQWIISQGVSCTSDWALTTSELQMLMDHKLPGSRNSKCFIACVFRKVAWLNDKGAFDESKAIEFSDHEYSDDATKAENAKKLFGMCKSVNEEAVTDGTDGCDRANSLAKCLVDHAPEVGYNLEGL